MRQLVTVLSATALACILVNLTLYVSMYFVVGLQIECLVFALMWQRMSGKAELCDKYHKYGRD